MDNIYLISPTHIFTATNAADCEKIARRHGAKRPDIVRAHYMMYGTARFTGRVDGVWRMCEIKNAAAALRLAA